MTPEEFVEWVRSYANMDDFIRCDGCMWTDTCNSQGSHLLPICESIYQVLIEMKVLDEG